MAITVLALGGMAAGLYPMAASWVSSYNQSKVISNYETQLDHVNPSVAEQLSEAKQYNDALSAGVVVGKNSNVPVGNGTSSNSKLNYDRILSSGAEGMIGRIKVPGIEVDLPIYHGTSDAVLARGAGHLQGSHFPTGGESTRSVITAHRGLANATMFSNLNHVKVGDKFTVEVFGEVLTYQVRETKVIAPEDTETLRVVPGEDLVSLITCTPLGINTHRIVVTGQRITPTPVADIQAAGEVPSIPGFPWWIVLVLIGMALVLTYLIGRGFKDEAVRQRWLATSTPVESEASEAVTQALPVTAREARGRRRASPSPDHGEVND
ncbi:class C sortase [Arthrobacter alpinus]|uniref:class C sortase n=1 Tax=Arthrobacter alpinus TaxID=656366 RepID=UPI001EF52B31|nr:class C sortase [Arthrobacter alpinus]